MTDTADNTPAPEARPEFDQLVFDLRAIVRRQGEGSLTKAEVAHRNAVEVMRRAATLFSEGKLSAIEVSRLHALKLRLDLMLPGGDQ